MTALRVIELTGVLCLAAIKGVVGDRGGVGHMAGALLLPAPVVEAASPSAIPASSAAASSTVLRPRCGPAAHGALAVRFLHASLK